MEKGDSFIYLFFFFYFFLAYELLRRTLGLGSTHRVWCVKSQPAVGTLGCRYSFRVGHWDVVAGFVLEM